MADHHRKGAQQHELLLHTPDVLPPELLQEADEGFQEDYGVGKKGISVTFAHYIIKTCFVVHRFMERRSNTRRTSSPRVSCRL